MVVQIYMRNKFKVELKLLNPLMLLFDPGRRSTHKRASGVLSCTIQS